MYLLAASWLICTRLCIILLWRDVMLFKQGAWLKRIIIIYLLFFGRVMANVNGIYIFTLEWYSKLFLGSGAMRHEEIEHGPGQTPKRMCESGGWMIILFHWKLAQLCTLKKRRVWYFLNLHCVCVDDISNQIYETILRMKKGKKLFEWPKGDEMVLW